jgi:hypothetical protein
MLSLVKARVAIPLVLASGLLGAVALVSGAFAAHPHPANGGADKLTFPMAVAMRACGPGGTAPNSNHGPPLGAPSCTPANQARQTSPNITTGKSPAGPYKGRSTFVIDVTCTNGQVPPCPAPGDQEDVKLTATATDIRCKAGANAGVCGNENGAPAGKVGDDYTGQVQGDATIRITDAFNGSPGFTTHGTVVNLPFPVTGNCANTANNTIGATCSTNTSADTVVPNVVKERKQANVEIETIHVNDGGPDGNVTTAPNSLFARQGIYIP